MTTTYTADQDNYYLPIEVTSGGVRCGNHPGQRVRHENTDAVRACFAIMADLAAEQAAECYAENIASWVTSGGNPADARRYADTMARTGTWDGGIGDFEFSGQTCVHGLAKELCADPVNHYPADSYMD